MLQGNVIGIYVRESRDENEENLDTIETQKGLLLEYVDRTRLGRIHNIYMDDNVSGSGFERPGLDRLKEDVEGERINVLLLKDLSRLGRNNAKTLLFLDYLEEKGVRVLTYDGRYDSAKDNETVGIETWANERYIRDISRKIRASLKYKIIKGEYIGNAPYGYKKSLLEKNRLCVDEDKAEVVKGIYSSYLNGNGYARIAGMLENEGINAPGCKQWSGVAIRRILCNRVYLGETIQGISEKISFKNHKTRRLPRSEWTVTPDTHAAIIEKDVFDAVQILIGSKSHRPSSYRSQDHVLSGLIKCGCCGSNLYARCRNKKQTFYVCGKYYKNGRKGCTSHFILESILLDVLKQELVDMLNSSDVTEKLASKLETGGVRDDGKDRLNKLQQALVLKQRQQEILYLDRLEEKIPYDLYAKTSKVLDEKISSIKEEIERLYKETLPLSDYLSVLVKIKADIMENHAPASIFRFLVGGITVYDPSDNYRAGIENIQIDGVDLEKKGRLIIDLKMNKVYDN